MRPFKVVDAFSNRPFQGNPVAVVLDAEGLSDAQMQTIARWTNLSETTFVLPAGNPEASYRLRIFTPRSELPFAGHPTLGSAHAILEAGRAAPRDGVLLQECGQGLVRIAIEGDDADRRITLDLPAATLEQLELSDIEELEAIIGARVNRINPPALVDVGPIWIVAGLTDAAELLALEPDYARLARFEQRLGVTGLSLFGKHSTGEAAIEVRSFAPSCGVEEDPVCGSGNGCVAVFLHKNRMLASNCHGYLATQGQKVGRAGRISVGVDDVGRITIGGTCVTSVTGLLAI